MKRKKGGELQFRRKLGRASWEEGLGELIKNLFFPIGAMKTILGERGVRPGGSVFFFLGIG